MNKNPENTQIHSGEPSLGYRAAAICGWILGAMVFLAFLIALIVFRRSLIKRCTRDHSVTNESFLQRSLSQNVREGGALHLKESDGSGNSSSNGKRNILTAQSKVPSTAIEAESLWQQPQSHSAVLNVNTSISGTGHAVEQTVRAPNKRQSQDSNISWVPSIHTRLADEFTGITDGHPQAALVDGKQRRRSTWQDILQAFKARRTRAFVDAAAIDGTTTISTMTCVPSTCTPDATMISACLTDISVPIHTSESSASESIPWSIDPRTNTTTAASIYSQVSLHTNINNSTVTSTSIIPPIIYCPRERAELDFLRHKYPTAAPGYTAYRLPPQGATSPQPSWISPAPFSRATSGELLTDHNTSDGTQVYPLNKTNRHTMIDTNTRPASVAVPVKPLPRPITIFTSFSHCHHSSSSTHPQPPLLTSPSNINTTITELTTTPSTPSPPQLALPTPTRRPKTLRIRLLPSIIDPVQSENHISNYFARNARPYAPYSYPKIYAPSYDDVEGLSSSSSSPPSTPFSPEMNSFQAEWTESESGLDHGAGVGIGSPLLHSSRSAVFVVK